MKKNVKKNYLKDIDYIRRNIRELIDIESIYQCDLAKDAGMTTCSLSLFLNGKKDIQLTTFIRLVDALNTSYDSLVIGHSNA